MSVRSAQAVTVLFSTRVFATGVGTVADSLPTGVLYLNGVSNAAAVTVTNVTAGLYTAAVTLPTLAVNDEVEIVITATVSSVTDKAVIWGDTKDVFAGAIPDVAAGAASGLALVGSAMTLAASQHVIVDSGTVTTVTNQLTAAAIATGVWQDATAGDFTTAGSIGKSLFTSGNAPGAASGLAIVGSVMGDSSGVTTLLTRISGTITITSGGVLVHSVDTGGISAVSFGASAITSTVAPNLDATVSSRATPAQILTTQLTESYRAAGAAPTLAQATFEIMAGLLDHSITGTTKTIRNIAGTAAKTYTLDSAVSPTSITETT